MLYSGDDSFADDEKVVEGESKYSMLRNKMEQDGMTQSSAISFLIFVLLYFPCVATIAAIKNEADSWGWAAFTAVYTTAVAWIIAFAAYNIARLV